MESKFFMLLQDHNAFFQRSITSPFSNTIDGTFYLLCSIYYAIYAVGCGQSQVIVTVSGNVYMFQSGYIVYQVGYFIAIFMLRQRL